MTLVANTNRRGTVAAPSNTRSVAKLEGIVRRRLVHISHFFTLLFSSVCASVCVQPQSRDRGSSILGTSTIMNFMSVSPESMTSFTHLDSDSLDSRPGYRPTFCAYRCDMLRCNTQPLRNAPRRPKRKAVKLYRNNGEIEGEVVRAATAAVWQ
jgi:hypothetical protein